MARYAIGDIQGCHSTLEALLERIEFDPTRDELLLCGDLVNRGPRSLDVLRWARGLGERVTTVLGNHDLHLLRLVAGARKHKRVDTIAEVLEAPDCDELIDWLRTRPLVHDEGDLALVHAGLLPRWSVSRAQELAGEVEVRLRSAEWKDFLIEVSGARPRRWRNKLTGPERWASVIAALTSVRACTERGELCADYAGPPDGIPAGYLPWYAFPERESAGTLIVFGHWAALGLHLEDDVVCLDSGCVWGRALTAMQLPDRAVFQQDAID